MVEINFPNHIPNTDDPWVQSSGSIKLLNQIDEHLNKGENNLTLNLLDIKWILPCSAVLLSHKINQLKKKGCNLTLIEPANYDAKSYLSSIGFPFGSIEIKQGYVPIYHFDRNIKMEQILKPIYKLIEQKFPESTQNSVDHLLSELGDNIDAHSEFNNGTIMAQHYPNKKYVDIAVFDDGIGISGSYQKNKVAFNDDCDAILKALRGVSVKKDDVGRGKGLETSKNLVKFGLCGEFHVLSRSGSFSSIYGKQDIIKKLEFSLKGTLIHARFKVPQKALNIYEYIE